MPASGNMTCEMLATLDVPAIEQSPASGNMMCVMLARLDVQVTVPASGDMTCVMDAQLGVLAPEETLGGTKMYAPAFASELYSGEVE